MISEQGVGDVSPLDVPPRCGAGAARFRAAAGGRTDHPGQRIAWPGARTNSSSRARRCRGRARRWCRCRAPSRRRAPRSSMVTVRGVRITGSTIYSAEDLEPLYRDLVGREVPVTAIYDIAQRITAKYGGDGYVLSRAIVPPQELSPRGAVVRHPDHRRLYRPGRMAAGAVEVSRLLLGLRGEDHRRAPGQRQDARALSAARERPARPASSPTASRPRRPIRARRRWWSRWWRSRSTCSPASTTAAPRRAARCSISPASTSTISARMHESLDAGHGRRVPDHRAAILDGELPAGAHQRRADAVRQQQLHPRQARHRDPAAPGIQDARRPVRSGPELSVHPQPREEPDRAPRCSSSATTAATSSARSTRSTGSAASA